MDMLNVHHMHTLVCRVFQWNNEQHLYRHSFMSMVYRFVSTNVPSLYNLCVALFMLSLCLFDISDGVGGFCHRTESDIIFLSLRNGVILRHSSIHLIPFYCWDNFPILVIFPEWIFNISELLFHLQLSTTCTIWILQAQSYSNHNINNTFCF